MRPPVISFVFFAAAAGLFAYGAFETHIKARLGATFERDAQSIEEMRARRVSAFVEAWPKAPAYRQFFTALEAGAAAPDMAMGRPEFDPDDDYYGLPDDAGRDLVAARCQGCHSLRIVMQQRAADERWAYMLQWMTQKQNMPPLPPDEEAQIRAYLVQHFGAR